MTACNNSPHICVPFLFTYSKYLVTSNQVKPTFHWSAGESRPKPRRPAVSDSQRQSISRIQPARVATFARWTSTAAGAARLWTRNPSSTHIFPLRSLYLHLSDSRNSLRQHFVPAFSYDFKEAFEAAAVMKRPEKYRKKYKHRAECSFPFSFFFLNVAVSASIRSRRTPSISIASMKRGVVGGKGTKNLQVSDQRKAIRFVQWPRRNRIHLVKNDTRRRRGGRRAVGGSNREK